MVLNDYPEELKTEEQTALNNLIDRMDHVIKSLDKKMRLFVAEARSVNSMSDPDQYLAILLAKQGKRDTEENRKRLIESRDELYDHRLLLQYEDEEEKGIEELKIGLHNCYYLSEPLVLSWTMPVCRHFVLDNRSTEFESIVKDRRGIEYHTNYKLLVKNQIKLRFTRVVSAANLFPGNVDDKMLETIKGTGFFTDGYIDRMIEEFNPTDYNPDEAAKIISDEFLKEILERRSSPEFKNIVFSIQKKQGEIIQAEFRNNMIVQGCAGSGKSMIMLHRLPIILFDNPTSLSRTNLYIITPSQMYIQMAENMRRELEISDIHMGTAEEYYDYCIEKYLRYRKKDYGRIDYSCKISRENERYIYSGQCTSDIADMYSSMCETIKVPLAEAYSVFGLKEPAGMAENTPSQRVNSKLLKIQTVLNANREALAGYFEVIWKAYESIDNLYKAIKSRKNDTLREIEKNISENRARIRIAALELEKINAEERKIAARNRVNTINALNSQIEDLEKEKETVIGNDLYFGYLSAIAGSINGLIIAFRNLKKDFSLNSADDIYLAIDGISNCTNGFERMISLLKGINDKYSNYLGPLTDLVYEAEKHVNVLRDASFDHVGFEYYKEISDEKDKLNDISANAVKNAYSEILKKIGLGYDDNNGIKAVRCSSYVYLQAIYQFQGAPSTGEIESLLAVDEAQGISPEELRLMKNVNRNKCVFNMFGDINQHIEGTKGVDTWNDFGEIIGYDFYEMQENYRNASQITEYCNHEFGMDMLAINTPGKGMHEIVSDEEFRIVMEEHLLDPQRVGLAAILVSSDAEARYLLDRFSAYDNKMHDMTDDDFSMHHTRWNIIDIDDAKGLEFSSVIVLSGRMSRNQRYIACTRALDELVVYPGIVDVTGFTEKPEKKNDENVEETSGRLQKAVKGTDDDPSGFRHGSEEEEADYENSLVRRFFTDKGYEVLDKRKSGGRLWVIGEKEKIDSTVNQAIKKFNISGRYMAGKESNYRNGWCTKTKK